MTDDRAHEAGRRLAHAWRAGSIVRARFASLGAIDIAFVD